MNKEGKKGKRNLSQGVVGNLTTTMILLPLGVLLSIVMARMLGPYGRGVYAYAALFGDTFFPLIMLGSSTGVFYYISSEKYDVRKVALTALSMGITNGITFGFIVYFLWTNQWLGSIAKELDISVILPILMTMPLTGIIWMSRQLFQGTALFNTLNKIELTKFLSKFLLLLIFVSILGWDVKGAIIALAIEDIISAIVVLIVIYRAFHPQFTYQPQFVKDAYIFGIRSWVGTIGGRANDKLDQILLGSMVKPESLGYYSNAYALLRFLSFGSNAVAPVLFKKIAKLDDINKSAVLTTQVHRILFYSVAILALLIGLSAPWLIPILYGESFRFSVLPLQIMLPGAVLFATTRRTISKFMTANGLNLYASYIQIVGAITGLGLYLYLIPRYDFIGAAIATTLASVISTLFAMGLFYKTAGSEIFRFFILKKEDFIWLKNRLFEGIPFLKNRI
jgi:O-antigen/teichoic acid export membrane protein